MKDEGVTKTDIANLLGLHFNTVTAKMEGETNNIVIEETKTSLTSNFSGLSFIVL